MKKIQFFLFALLVCVLFFSCQTIPVEELVDTKVIITMSVPDSSDLKSALMEREIDLGDTVSITNLQNMNIVFSADNQNGQPISGQWEIYLKDADNDEEYLKLFDRPRSDAKGSIASIKPEKLGLYYVGFTYGKSNEVFYFFLKHFGLPGTIGDNENHDYVFRMEKERFVTSEGNIESGYSLYLKCSENEFENWSPQNGINPTDENNFKAVMFCGRENYFNDGCRGLNSGNRFMLKKCQYSSYVIFSFLEKEYPPLHGSVSYKILFYSGNMGCEWWTFSAMKQSGWSAENGLIQFNVL